MNLTARCFRTFSTNSSKSHKKRLPLVKADFRELLLRPYTGRLYLAKTKEAYEREHLVIFKEPDILTCAQDGRFSAGPGHDGIWTYLIWASAPHTLAHEISHAILHVFQRVGIDPRDAGGEPFCYLLSQLLLDAAHD